MRQALTVLALGVVLAGAAVEAHHSIAAVYDSDRSVTIDGIVRVFRFANPHPTVAVEIAGPADTVETWQLEMDNLRELSSEGMTADSLAPGDRIVVTGSPSRMAPRTLYVRRLDRPADGFWYEQVGTSPSVGIGS